MLYVVLVKYWSIEFNQLECAQELPKKISPLTLDSLEKTQTNPEGIFSDFDIGFLAPWELLSTYICWLLAYLKIPEN